MKIKKDRIFSVIFRWIALIFVLIFVFTVFVFDVAPLVFTYAKSRAETTVLNAANQAVLNVIEKENIKYSDVSNVSRDESGKITGIEIDTQQINMLKSRVSNELSSITSKNDSYTLKIPLGTLLGNEYITGYGPRISFKIQFTETSILDFESRFEDAGINNVLHQIIINMDIFVNILMLGYTKGFSVSTSAIAAQTVISGEVPDSFTDVAEYPGGDLADEIFNYADLY